MERGFKTWCEKYATEKRRELNIDSNAPLDPRILARHLGVLVWTPRDIPGLSAETVATLLRNDGVAPTCWSAVTVVVPGRTVIILNSSHSNSRQSSDLAHELAHLIRGHKAQGVDVTEDGLLLLHSYEKAQEEEADWLAGALLLPREALVHALRRQMSIEAISLEFGVSKRMTSYRIATTGAQRQMSRAGAVRNKGQ